MSELEQHILERYASTGDSEAFHELVEQHQNMVFAVCHRVLGNAADAEDAAQETFLRLVHKADGLRAPIAGWLHHVATQVSINVLRQKQARAKRDVKAAQLNVGARASSWEDVKSAVDQVIAELPEDLRVPLVLHYLEGRKLADIGAELGITESAVSKRVKRAVQAVQIRLRKGGWQITLAALVIWLSHSTTQAAPATLTASLGKMALAGSSSSGASGTAASGVTTSTFASKGAVAVLALIAVVTVSELCGLTRVVPWLADRLTSDSSVTAPAPTPVIQPITTTLPAPSVVTLPQFLQPGLDLVYAMETVDGHATPPEPLQEDGRSSAVLRIFVADVNENGEALVAESVLDIDYTRSGNPDDRFLNVVWTGRLSPSAVIASAGCWAERVSGQRSLGSGEYHCYIPTGVAAQRLIHPGAPSRALVVGISSWERFAVPLRRLQGGSRPMPAQSFLRRIGEDENGSYASIETIFEQPSHESGEMFLDIKSGYVRFMQEQRWDIIPEYDGRVRWRLKLKSVRVLPPAETARMKEMILAYNAQQTKLDESAHKRPTAVNAQLRLAGDTLLDTLRAGVAQEIVEAAHREAAEDPLRIRHTQETLDPQPLHPKGLKEKDTK